MKNKKLFAILTLVCFMMTLMPVAAFAADPAVTNIEITYTDAYGNAGKVENFGPTEDIKLAVGSTITKIVVTFDQNVTPGSGADATTDYDELQVSMDNGVTWSNFSDVPAGAFSGKTITLNQATEFAPGLGGVVAGNAKFQLAANVISGVTTPMIQNGPQGQPVVGVNMAYDQSIFVPTDGSADVVVGEGTEYTLKFRTQNGTYLEPATFTTGAITVWAEEASKPGISTSALVSVDLNGAAKAQNGTAAGDTAILYSYNITGAKSLDKVNVKFSRPGVYKVYAAETAIIDKVGVDKVASSTVAGIVKLLEVGETVTVTSTTTVIPATDYTADITVTPAAALTVDKGTVTEGKSLGTIATVAANNINDITVKVDFDCLGQDLAGKTVAISTNSANVNVSKEMATTNVLGAIEFAVSAAREGVYAIYLTVDGCTWTIDVECGNTSAAYIAVDKAPTALVPLYGTVGAGTNDDLDIQVFVTDINGNAVLDKNGITNATTVGDAKYVSFTAKPAASKLTSKDLNLVVLGDGFFGLTTNGKMLDAEGNYEVKIVLDNGNYVTVPFTVKEFQTPVRLILAYPQNNIELGGTLVVGKLAWMDANGVMKNAAGKVELAATGYAVANFATNGMLTVKSDEKYVGSTVTVTAVDSRYDLVATTTLTVADEAAGLAFESNTAEVNVNNKITVNVVDAKGNKTALGVNTGATQANISYVVLDKPADAKVSVYTADDSKLTVQGKFVMALTSNKVGNVKVQAVVKLTTAAGGVGTPLADVNQVKYYTGVQEFAVGTGEVGKSVVMSIGSNELIVGSKVETMDAKPMVQNSRTFVPFRALAEAFGATVAYDQATSSVTAELNGVKVVMTVGAPVYTVNGVEKTADVAPFISDSRTFVPVRFAAEAFGIEVVPTYNEDGSVADVLFNM